MSGHLHRLRGDRRWVLGVVLLATFAVNITLTILGIAIKPIAQEFGATTGDTAWITLGPIVVASLLTPAAGRVADRFGRKRVWLAGFTVTILGMTLSGLAWSLPALIGARLVTGIGTAWVMPAGLAMATSHYPVRERATPIGLWTATVAFSPALGIVGGVVVEWLSWRWLFWIQLPVAIIALLLAVFVLDEQRIPVQGRFDWAGTVTAALAIFGVLVAINQGPKTGWTSPLVLAGMALFAVFTPLFLRAETRATNPVVPLKLFSEPALGNGMVSRFMINAAYMGSFIVMPLFLANVWDWNLAVVSFALLPRPVAMGITGPLIRRLSDRFGEGPLTVVGSALVTIAITILIFLPDSPSYPVLLVALVLQGLGLGLASASIGTVVTQRAPAELLAPAASTLALTSQLANSAGIAVLLTMVAVGGGDGDPGAFALALTVGAVLAGIGLVTAIRMSGALGGSNALPQEIASDGDAPVAYSPSVEGSHPTRAAGEAT